MKKKKNITTNIYIIMKVVIKINQQFDEEFNPIGLSVYEFENTTGTPVTFTRDDIGNYISNELANDGQLYCPFFMEQNGAGGRWVLLKNDSGLIHLTIEGRRIRLECYDNSFNQVDFNSIINDNHWLHLPEIRVYP